MGVVWTLVGCGDGLSSWWGRVHRERVAHTLDGGTGGEGGDTVKRWEGVVRGEGVRRGGVGLPGWVGAW